MDAVADITAVCLLTDRLAPDEIIASPVHVGSAAAFMITGPVTKISNLGALKIVLGVKRLLFYSGFVMAFSFVTGLIVNLLL